MAVYEGKENYIFVSYAHKDADAVLPIIKSLDENGFRVWYDSGIEAGTEWPEYIEDHLSSSKVVLVFMSPAAVESRNCRNEINFALELQKEVLIIYLEETQLLKGMRLQLNSTQSLFRNNHDSYESFISSLTNAQILQSCRKISDRIYRNNDFKNTDKIQGTNSGKDPRIAFINSIGTVENDDFWPEGTYSKYINRDEFNVICFHIKMLHPFGIKGVVRCNYTVYNANKDIISEQYIDLECEPYYDRASIAWIIRDETGAIPTGDYTFECSVHGSPKYNYEFSIYSEIEENSIRRRNAFTNRINIADTPKKRTFWDRVRSFFE